MAVRQFLATKPHGLFTLMFDLQFAAIFGHHWRSMGLFTTCSQHVRRNRAQRASQTEAEIDDRCISGCVKQRQHILQKSIYS